MKTKGYSKSMTQILFLKIKILRMRSLRKVLSLLTIAKDNTHLIPYNEK